MKRDGIGAWSTTLETSSPGLMHRPPQATTDTWGNSIAFGKAPQREGEKSSFVGRRPAEVQGHRRPAPCFAFFLKDSPGKGKGASLSHASGALLVECGQVFASSGAHRPHTVRLCFRRKVRKKPYPNTGCIGHTISRMMGAVPRPPPVLRGLNLGRGQNPGWPPQHPPKAKHQGAERPLTDGGWAVGRKAVGGSWTATKDD